MSKGAGASHFTSRIAGVRKSSSSVEDRFCDPSTDRQHATRPGSPGPWGCQTSREWKGLRWVACPEGGRAGSPVLLLQRAHLRSKAGRLHAAGTRS
eukprot:767192-Hanusia_phi.AAC.2